MKMKDSMSVKLKTIKEKINIKQESMYKVGRTVLLILMICVAFTYVGNICVFTVVLIHTIILTRCCSS